MSKKTQHLQEIRERFLRLNEEYLKQGASLADLRLANGIELHNKQNSKSIFRFLYNKKFILVILLPLLYSIIIKPLGTDFIIKYMQGTRCFLLPNYFTWEFSRPVSNCDFCRGLSSPLVLDNVTKEEFQKYAYSSQPIIVKKAASHWMASKVFSLYFFRSLYENINGAYESVEEECQFLPFRSNFANLKEVFSMSDRRAMNLPGEEPWYVGWKNCHPQVLDIMKRFYQQPHFLPDDAEQTNTNYIFLGYGGGADMHIDYIPRLMWQAQIIGSKTWTLAPTPECDNICEPFDFFVDTGDILLLDTRIWYHGTQPENRQLSLTVTSEYG